MTESSTKPATPAAGAPANFLDRHHFLFRRLHSLSGIAPIGIFMVVHLITNSSIVWGAINASKGNTFLERVVATFQKEVYFIHNLPFLILIEIFGLWLPIAFHAALGVYYARTGRSNTKRYEYQSNWRYSLQRSSGYVALAFIFYHVATLRWGWTFMVPDGAEWSFAYASSSLAHALQGSTDGITFWGMVVGVFYFVGVTAAVFHFANGLWTAAITWGITVSRRAQIRWGYACAGLGVALMGLAWSAVIGFYTLDHDKAQAVEAKLMPADVREKLIERGEYRGPTQGVTSGENTGPQGNIGIP